MTVAYAGFPQTGSSVTVAGNGARGYSGDGGPAIRVQVGNTSSQAGITIAVR